MGLHGEGRHLGTALLTKKSFLPGVQLPVSMQRCHLQRSDLSHEQHDDFSVFVRRRNIFKLEITAPNDCKLLRRQLFILRIYMHGQQIDTVASNRHKMA